ncbi:MAG: hypothetical protein JXB45_11665 [Candidatus Krumholzibacteriota bacterium]|nr:hypothetical protein [Candidatus Krumholzibacteriota bacterium]
MGMFKKKWSPRDADRWTWEDTITVVISPVIYVLILVGCALAALLKPVGFILVIIAIALTVIMIGIINPKLTAISEDYEKKQKDYMEELERKVKWED